MGRRLTASQRSEQLRTKRDLRIRKMYMTRYKTGELKYTIRSLAEKVGLSKTRVGEIVMG